jgi:translation initiation factor IF-2
MIEIEDMITVGALAERLKLPVTRLITELFKNGIMATVNEKIDFETAQIIVEELGLDIALSKKVQVSNLELALESRKARKSGSQSGDTRPPVVAVMGHVDHGKTSLLDAIRGAHVVKGEAGGITQHISAYQITHGSRKITFLDTPGHEAFAALREHGAQLTDLVIIVVAADDGVKPQTVEAIRFARKAGVKILVAINKMDKEGADPNRVKQQLSEHELLIEEWGGDTVVMPVSAKTKEGIPELLDMILLVADVEDLRAETSTLAEGLIIESHMEQGRGAVAVALIEQGTLKQGSFIVAGPTYAKIRNLETTSAEVISEAGPSTPVVISGFKAMPEFGTEFHAVATEKEARTMAAGTARDSQAGRTMNISSNELIRMINRQNEVNELNVIIKADVQGSLTSVVDSLKTLDNEEVAVRVIGTGVGAINENDVRMAATSNAVIYGFHTDMPVNVKRLASRDKVSVRIFKIIYELIDDVKAELTTLLAPEEVITEHGRLVVRGIFKGTKTDGIVGGEVTKGKLTAPALARVMRGSEQIAEIEVTGLKRGPQEAKEIIEGEMCGMSYKSSGRVDIQEGDHIEFFSRAIVERTL